LLLSSEVNKLRIGIIFSTPLPPREGIGFFIWNLSRFLTTQGHCVHLITRGGLKHETQEVTDGITIHRIPFIPIYPYHVHLHNIFMNRWLRQTESELDLLHLHSPLVKFPQTNLPVIATIHTPIKADITSITQNNFINILAKLQAPFSIRIEEDLLKKANRIVTVAKSVANDLHEYGIDFAQIGVLGVGVDTKQFFPQFHRTVDTNPYLFTAGRLVPRKGLEDLVRCAELVVNELPNVRFLIAGDGPIKKELQKKIIKRGLSEHVILLGHIFDRKHLAELYQGAIAYVHPAHYEGLPAVMLEAMACACPVVATAVSGALDVIEDGVNGLLVPEKNPEAMATSIFRLVQDPELSETISRAASYTINSRFTWQIVTQKYLDEYRLLL
jgi:glycosyltransferase involved in cell wall biosynthesis